MRAVFASHCDVACGADLLCGAIDTRKGEASDIGCELYGCRRVGVKRVQIWEQLAVDGQRQRGESCPLHRESSVLREANIRQSEIDAVVRKRCKRTSNAGHAHCNPSDCLGTTTSSSACFEGHRRDVA